MGRYKKSHKTLQSCESILRDEYDRGTLSEELLSRLQAKGMVLRSSERWDFVVEQRPASPPPLPQPMTEDEPVLEDVLAEPPVNEEAVDLRTPETSSTTEEGAEVPLVEEATEAPLPKGGAQASLTEHTASRGETYRVEANMMENTRMEMSSTAIEGEGEWLREGYGICVGCGDTYIVRCGGEESPWAKGSDKPQEKDGKFLIECGDCEGQEEQRPKAKKAAGFGEFGSAFQEAEWDIRMRATFARIRISPALFEGATRSAIPDTIRHREVPFVTVHGGVAFLEMGEVLRSLPKGADVGIIRLDRFRKGHQTGLIGHGIGGLI